MGNYIVLSGFYISHDKPIPLLKCKRCKNEFAVLWNGYVKTICFCPSCGQQNNPKKHTIKQNED